VHTTLRAGHFLLGAETLEGSSRQPCVSAAEVAGASGNRCTLCAAASTGHETPPSGRSRVWRFMIQSAGEPRPHAVSDDKDA
jgi:hypothetical protein